MITDILLLFAVIAVVILVGVIFGFLEKIPMADPFPVVVKILAIIVCIGILIWVAFAIFGAITAGTPMLH